MVQQRSPAIKARRAEFSVSLAQWIKSSRFIRVVVLASLDAGLRTDTELTTPLMHWAPSDAAEPAIIPCPRYAPNIPQVPEMPGADAARRLLAHADASWSALLLFAAEGDNRGDAHALSASISEALGLPQSRFPEPESWRAMYGSEPTELLYG